MASFQPALPFPHRGRANLALAAIALCTVCMTPYALDYDLVILGVAMAWLGRELYERTSPARGLEMALVALWVVPFVSRPLAAAGFPIAGLVIVTVLGAIWRWQRRDAAQPDTQQFDAPDSDTQTPGDASGL